MMQMVKKLGIKDNWISSVKVKSGYKITLYENDNFQGKRLVKKSNNSNLNKHNFYKMDSNGDYVQVTMNVSKAGKYNLDIRYASPYDKKIETLYINGSKVKEVEFPMTSRFESGKEYYKNSKELGMDINR